MLYALCYTPVYTSCKQQLYFTDCVFHLPVPNPLPRPGVSLVQGSDADDSTGAHAGGDTPPHPGRGQGGLITSSLLLGADDEDADLAAAIAASLADRHGGVQPRDHAGSSSACGLIDPPHPIPEEPEAGPGTNQYSTPMIPKTITLIKRIVFIRADIME